MKGILLAVCALALVVVCSSESFARGGRRGGDMMVCNSQQAAGPIAAQAENVKITEATKVLRPATPSCEIVVFTGTNTGVNLLDLQALNQPIGKVPNLSNVASK